MSASYNGKNMDNNHYERDAYRVQNNNKKMVMTDIKLSTRIEIISIDRRKQLFFSFHLKTT